MSSKGNRAEGQAVGLRWGLRGKLLIAIGVVLSGTLFAAGVGLLSNARFGDTFDAVALRAVPSMTGALRMSQSAERLVALAPALAAAESLAEKEAQSQRLAEERARFETNLAELAQWDLAAEDLARLRSAARDLLANLDQLDQATTARLGQIELRTAQVPVVVAAAAKIQELLAPLKAFYENETESLHEPFAREDSEAPEMRRVGQRLAKITEELKPIHGIDQNTIALRSLLLEAASSFDVERLKALEAAAPALVSTMDKDLLGLSERARANLTPSVEVMKNAARAADNVVVSRIRELDMLEQLRGLVAKNRELSAQLGEVTGTLVATQDARVAGATAATRDLLRGSTIGLVAASVASVVVSILIIWLYVGRILIRRLLTLRDVMRRIAAGELSLEVPSQGSDEIAEMAAAVVVFRDTAREVEAANARTAEERERAAAERRQAMLDMAKQFEARVSRSVAQVAAAADQMRAMADTMVRTAGQTRQQADAATSATIQANEHVNGASAAAQELSSSIREISRQVQESASIAARAVQEAQTTDGTMQGLTEAASRIGEIVHLINGIAGQTNLLALNATIEAARAGEAGKGFAVVASEVKSLANQTAKATEEISTQIAAMQAVSAEAAAAIRRIGATIGSIDEITGGVAAAVEQQGAATAEIARSVSDAAVETTKASSNMGEVGTAAADTGQSAGQVLTAASDLSTQADQLRAQIDAFLKEVRAA